MYHARDTEEFYTTYVVCTLEHILLRSEPGRDTHTSYNMTQTNSARYEEHQT